MVAVAEPMAVGPLSAVTMTVSFDSSMVSCTALTVVVTEVAPAASVSEVEAMVKSSVSVAVPPRVRLMVCSVAKDVAPVLTVTVEVPAASAMEAGSTAIESVGASSSSVMVTVAEPMAVEPLLAETMTVSSGSSTVSCTAVTVVVTEVAPAASVSEVEAMVKSSVSVAVPPRVRLMVCSVAKDVAPVLTVTVEVPAASAMEAGSTAIESVGASSSSAIDTVAVSPVGEG